MTSTRGASAVDPATNDTKTRILRVAADLFMRNGFASTSVRQIGQEAGVSQSALYHHIRSKAHLLKALHGRFIDEMLDRMRSAVESDRSSAERLSDAIGVVLSIIETHQAEVTVFLREQHALPPAMRRAIVKRRDEVDRLIDRLIAEGIADGTMRSDLDPRLVRLGILGMCNWAYQWYRLGDRSDSQTIARTFSSIAIDGMRNER